MFTVIATLGCATGRWRRDGRTRQAIPVRPLPQGLVPGRLQPGRRPRTGQRSALLRQAVDLLLRRLRHRLRSRRLLPAPRRRHRGGRHGHRRLHRLPVPQLAVRRDGQQRGDSVRQNRESHRSAAGVADGRTRRRHLCVVPGRIDRTGVGTAEDPGERRRGVHVLRTRNGTLEIPVPSTGGVREHRRHRAFRNSSRRLGVRRPRPTATGSRPSPR
jgi:hypothetical protein